MPYAASMGQAGNPELPISRGVQIDLTAPVVRVTGVQDGALDQAGNGASASVTNRVK